MVRGVTRRRHAHQNIVRVADFNAHGPSKRVAAGDSFFAECVDVSHGNTRGVVVVGDDLLDKVGDIHAAARSQPATFTHRYHDGAGGNFKTLEAVKTVDENIEAGICEFDHVAAPV